jgi:hypothetical protein
MWVYGGEFMSPTGSQFKTYRDLWVLHLSGPQAASGAADDDHKDESDEYSDDSDDDKPKKVKPAKKETKAAPAVAATSALPCWEEVKLKGGPPARSGHRMIVYKRKLLVYGGFHDNGTGDVKYYSDLWSLDLDGMIWTKHETPAAQPAPTARSGFSFFVNGDVAFLYGGYRTDKVKGDVEKGVVMNDMWQLDLINMTWSNIKNPGSAPSLRSGCTMAVVKKRAYLFGGVSDNDVEEDLESTHHNDMYYFSLSSKRWASFVPGTRGEDDDDKKAKKLTKKEKEAAAAAAKTATATAPAKAGPGPSLAAGAATAPATPAVAATPAITTATTTTTSVTAPSVFIPPPRRSTLLAVKSNTLFLYGGMVEEKEKEITFNDFYSLDCASDTALWQTLVAAEAKWVGDADDEADGDDDDDEEDDEKESKGKGKGKKAGAGKEEKKGTAAAASSPAAAEVLKADEPGTKEVLADFFARTRDHWSNAVRQDKPDAVDKEVRRLAFELASTQYEKINKLRKDEAKDNDDDEDGEGDDDDDDEDEEEEEEEELPKPAKKSAAKQAAPKQAAKSEAKKEKK